MLAVVSGCAIVCFCRLLLCSEARWSEARREKAEESWEKSQSSRPKGWTEFV